ncbi:PRC-barrel domain containing protein [Cereibacter sphaeroides]|uniref:PRC-barrel domain containing protein n=1 Tax=Cereibacter sphaeroides TaxID=1063 RepID=A0AAX1UR36_CERSP|nr:PRC-barrel domain-containing protein [Cereibacter sphaeroides]RHZ98256.1 PRC-barrel domain containing protein [Cereibacter sphaeroides]SNS22455.1 PRC-barrel domain-containing protein [[Luteovulum] sphaeroides subsp. megalophilum]
MKKVIALSALLASTTAYAALAQDATTTPDATTPPAATTETTPPATGMDATGTDTMAPAAGDTAPAATTGMTGTDTGMAEGMQIPEGYTAYAGEPMTAEDLQDADVYSMNDESVSDISDFVLAEDGKVEQVIFDVGGFLGIGARNVAVPFEDLKIYTNEDQSDVRVYVPMSREELEALPEYTAAE